jgi:hypothetical protein
MRTLPGVALSESLAEGGGLNREPFALVNVLVEQRQRRLPRTQKIVVAGLVQLLREIGKFGERGAEGRRRILQLRGRRQEQDLGVPFLIIGLLGQVDDHVCDLGSSSGSAGGPRDIVLSE